MKALSIPRAAALFLYLLLTAVLAGGVGWFAYSEALDQVAERGRADLLLATDRLTEQLHHRRELGVLLADHPQLKALLRGQGDPAAADALLLEAGDKTGSLEVSLANAEGRIVASSFGPNRRGADLSGRALMTRAMDGALGADHDVDEGLRRFSFAAPVFSAEGPVIGAVLISVSGDQIEDGWHSAPTAVFFTDEAGVVFVANRSELLFRTRHPEVVTDRYPADILRPFVDFSGRMVAGHDIWQVDGGRFIPSRALHIAVPVPVLDMQGEILLDATPAERLAFLQAAVVAALALAFGTLLFLASERRRRLSDQLATEEAAKSELETRVARRTRALSEANAALRHEIVEREEAEAALKQAQDDLVQAGKLSALGQMSAGISHELNQPLMAIRSFAENAEHFLEKGKTEAAEENLGRISDLARRMGRIIKNLRAFARQEREPLVTVDLGRVVEAALELSETRLRQDGVDVTWQRPTTPVLVRGGEVRLQQVVLNLISNAADAMEGGIDKRLEIVVVDTGSLVALSVRDTGPGLEAPEKIFEPFYTTKEVGRSEGMGLGLSISYGLVQGFGGSIRGGNHPEGGAVFTVELARSEADQAA